VEVFSVLAQACVVVVCTAQRQFSPVAKLAVGYLLDELKNDITRETPA
jgi:carbamoylphosphate synthase large subunit